MSVPQKGRIKRTLQAPCLNSSGDMEVSIHALSSSQQREISFTFPDRDTGDMLAIVTMSKADVDLVDVGPVIEEEKDRLLRKFYSFAEEVCSKLWEVGRWADFIDPCSGLPMKSEANGRPYDEVSAAEALLGFSVQNASCCKILLHPKWGSHVYPATVFTTAPLELLENILRVKLAD